MMETRHSCHYCLLHVGSRLSFLRGHYVTHTMGEWSLLVHTDAVLQTGYGDDVRDPNTALHHLAMLFILWLNEVTTL